MICVCYDVDILISGYAVDERAQFIMGGYCALYISMVLVYSSEKPSYFMDIKSVALFFGSVVYAFEGIGMASVLRCDRAPFKLLRPQL